MIVATHPSIEPEDVAMDLNECHRCHVTHDWRHLRMLDDVGAHGAGEGRTGGIQEGGQTD